MDQARLPPLLRPCRHVVRVTIEATTPISVSSGESDPDCDAPLFRDWNDLPTLSGTTIAGVLRSLHLDQFADETATNELFGYEESRTQEGAAARLTVSFGIVHDQTDRSVDGYRLPGDLARDPVLRFLAGATPVKRDHVAISHTGAARDHLKFDRTSCPIGTRFSLELGLDGDADAEAQRRDERLLIAAANLLAIPYARFGAAGRRGLGHFKVVRAAYAVIDRTGERGRLAWIAHRRAPIDGRAAEVAWRNLEIGGLALSGNRRAPIRGEIRLTPKGYWRLGQGVTPWHVPADEKVPNDMPLSEPVIEWVELKGGSVVNRPGLAPVPGAGVKGAIAHRCEFHLRRLQPGFGTGTPPSADERLADVLFGSARDDGSGRAGAVLIDDVKVDFRGLEDWKRSGTRTRTSIDRHTGGVRLGKLFTDEALWQGPEWVIPITVQTRVLSPSNPPVGLSAEAITALDWTLEDLCTGRLALGAREAAGDGVFASGEISWFAGGRTYPTLTAAMAAINPATGETGP
jgi:hypothetical protein